MEKKTLTERNVSKTIDKSAFRTLTYGLFIIGSKNPDGRKVGCVVNTFQQIANDPPKVCVSLNKQNATTNAVLKSGRFTASVLSQTATMDLIGVFGFRSSLDVEKFEGFDHNIDSAQMPCLRQECMASFSVCVEQHVDVGSHILFIGTVEETCMLEPEGQTPLTYSYYHEVLRGKTPPKAASYFKEEAPGGGSAAGDGNGAASANDATDASAVASIANDANPANVTNNGASKPKYAWRCTLCGHIEYMDELPDDFTCPICGGGKEMFERIEL